MKNVKPRGPRVMVVGTVTSDKMAKTIVVQSERLARHSRYPRYIRRVTAYKAHDEKNEAKVGDVVEIASTRPLSKTKHWRLVRVVQARSGPA